MDIQDALIIYGNNLIGVELHFTPSIRLVEPSYKVEFSEVDSGGFATIESITETPPRVQPSFDVRQTVER